MSKYNNIVNNLIYVLRTCVLRKDFKMLDLNIKSAKEVKQERNTIEKCAYQVYKYLINATTKFIEDNYQDLLQQSVNYTINQIRDYDKIALKRALVEKVYDKEFLYLSSF